MRNPIIGLSLPSPVEKGRKSSNFSFKGSYLFYGITKRNRRSQSDQSSYLDVACWLSWYQWRRFVQKCASRAGCSAQWRCCRARGRAPCTGRRQHIYSLNFTRKPNLRCTKKKKKIVPTQWKIKENRNTQFSWLKQKRVSSVTRRCFLPFRVRRTQPNTE